MSKTEIFNKVRGTFSKAAFGLKKHSPEILVVAGVIGTVASAVIACKATTKVSGILEDTKEQLDIIHDFAGSIDRADEYSAKDAERDTAIVYIQTGVKFAKLYAPAVALGALSIASIVTSNNILRKRNIALAAAYTAVDKGFKEYRSRVVERFGEEIDRELRYNIKAKKFEEIVADENGEEKKVEKTVNVADPNVYSDFARVFDEANPNWRKDPEFNLMFLRGQQQYANDLLMVNGHLFLNEVYDMLGIPRTKAGQIVGWIYDPDNECSDSFVDFGIYEVNRAAVCDFINGYERSIILDFNVDGNILERAEIDKN